MSIYDYDESQDLIHGQKQHKLESNLIRRICGVHGLTRRQTIYCIKFDLLCKRQRWSLKECAEKIGTTIDTCQLIRDRIVPFTSWHQQQLYKTTNIRISTVRIKEEVHNLQQSRRCKYEDIIEPYKHIKKPPFKTKNLFGEAAPYFPSYKFKDLGLALKAWRAVKGMTQYTLSDKILIQYKGDDSWPFTKRDYWHQVETKDRITHLGAKAFYYTFGITIQEATAPYLEYIKQTGNNGRKVLQGFVNEQNSTYCCV